MSAACHENACSKRRRVESCSMEQLLELLLVQDADNSQLNSHTMSDSVVRVMNRQASDGDKLQFLQKSLALGSHLQDVSSRLIRQNCTTHNAHVWPFAHDLSVKIFSCLGTESICRAAATCTMFNKLAMDAGCYTSIDLTKGGSSVTDETVAKLIRRAGRCLRTLKLGVALHECKLLVLPSLKFPLVTGPQHTRHCDHNWSICPLSKSCLRPLEAVGTRLKSLHLYNIEAIDSKFLCNALAACPCILELAIVELNVSMRSIMGCLGSHCHELEVLSCRQSKPRRWNSPGESIRSDACSVLVQGCPKITSLTVCDYRISDNKVAGLVKGLPRLTYANFSGTGDFRGTCLRDIIRSQRSSLQTLILRDCSRLKEAEVECFISALSAGEFKTLKHLDLCRLGRLRLSPEAVSRLRSERPSLCFVVNHPDHSDSDSVSLDYTEQSSQSSAFDNSDTNSSESDREGSGTSLFDELFHDSQDEFLGSDSEDYCHSP